MRRFKKARAKSDSIGSDLALARVTHIHDDAFARLTLAAQSCFAQSCMCTTRSLRLRSRSARRRRCGVADFEAPAIEAEDCGESSPAVRKALLAHVSLPKVAHVIDTDSAPFIPHGWTIEEHRSLGRLSWSDESASLWIAPGQHARPIKGVLLRNRI